MPFKSNIPTFIAGLPDALDQGAEETAKDVVDLAKQLVPVDEGDLQETIRVKPKERDGERDAAAGGISGPNKFVDYAVFVEYGGAGDDAAQPFMTPAATNIDPAFRYKPLLKELERRSKI